MYYDQEAYTVRFEWGIKGVEALAPLSDVCIIVDVLSFSTSVDVATARGATIFPYRGDAAETFAASQDALLAGGADHPYSLRPSSLVTIDAGARLVLPSPNGSLLTVAAAEHAIVLTGCLRNAAAVATRAHALGQSIAVIAAGERWDLALSGLDVAPRLKREFVRYAAGVAALSEEGAVQS